jgi:hypothetical protein
MTSATAITCDFKARRSRSNLRSRWFTAPERSIKGLLLLFRKDGVRREMDLDPGA